MLKRNLLLVLAVAASLSLSAQLNSHETTAPNLNLETEDQLRVRRNQEIIIGGGLFAAGAGVASMDLSDRKYVTGGGVISSFGTAVLIDAWIKHRQSKGKWTDRVTRKSLRVKKRARKKSKSQEKN